jgi:glycosyltransferase involved in cell wall biosynthesis
MSRSRLSVIVCAHNEARYLPACLHSLLAQTRVPDEILVVNNASTDATRAVALQIPSVRVVDEPRKGLVAARETGRRAATGDVLVYLDADWRAGALEAIGGFDTSIEFHGEDTNVGRRLFAIGRVEIVHDCYLYTSARRYKAMGKGAVFRLYVRNFMSELLHHRPRDTSHVDVRT